MNRNQFWPLIFGQNFIRVNNESMMKDFMANLRNFVHNCQFTWEKIVNFNFFNCQEF
jgi:hypothetical protein